MMKGLKIRVSLSHKLILMRLRRRNPVCQKAKRIGIPACKIEVSADSKMVKTGHTSHIIMADWPVGMSPDGVNLSFIKGNDRIRHKSAIGHVMSGVCLCYCRNRQTNI